MSPVERNKNLRFLIREALARKELSGLRSHPSELLASLVTPPATIAFWIRTFAPELSERPALRIALLGAGLQDGVDDGCWYGLIPWLIGNEGMRIEIDMVGPELFEEPRSHGIPTTRAGCTRTPAHASNPGLPPARLIPSTAGAYLESKIGAEPIDLFFLFQPGLEDLGEYSWFALGELDAVCSRGARIGLSSFSEEEFLTEDWVCRMMGYQPGRKHVINPFGGQDTHVGAWAGLLWEIEAGPPSDWRIEDSRMQRYQAFLEAAGAKMRRTGDLFAPGAGRLATIPVRTEQGVERQDVVGLLYEGSAVSLVNGQVLDISRLPATHYPDMDEVIVPLELRARYPAADDHGFERILWASEVSGWVEGATDVQSEGDEFDLPHAGGLLEQMAKLRASMPAFGPDGELDDRLFPMSNEDMLAGVGAFIEKAIGKKVDPEQFLQDMRAQGGLHGPVHDEWMDLLEFLGWDLCALDDPARLDPAFTVHSERLDKEFPFVCEAYAYSPGDDGDPLVNEAKEVLAGAYPGGVVLGFKSMPYKEVDGKKYTFGGLFYYKQQWRPFALSKAIDSFDALLVQRESGFSFNSPTKEYADENAQIAHSFNLMTEGADTQKPHQMVGIRSGDWITPMRR